MSSKKKAIVTGGAGFIGSHVADLLLQSNYDVIVIDNLKTGYIKNIPKGATFIEADLAQRNCERLIKKDLKDADVVFHLAALARVQPSITNPVAYDKINTQGTLRMLKLAADVNVRRFVFSSSSAIYGNVEEKDLPTNEEAEKNPLSPYGAQKLMGEVYCKMFSQVYGLETVCLRYFNVFGERQSLDGAYKLVMGIFARQLLNGEPMTVTGDGEQRRDFVYVKDVAEANFLAATSRFVGNGEAINIGSGHNVSVKELAGMMGGPKIHIAAVKEPRETLADATMAKHLLGWEAKTRLDQWIPGYKKQLNI